MLRIFGCVRPSFGQAHLSTKCKRWDRNQRPSLEMLEGRILLSYFVQANINEFVNSNIRSYTNGSDYPVGGTSLPVGGVPFTLAKYAGGGTGIIQTPESSSSAFDVPVSIDNPDTVYTLINSTYGVRGVTIGSVEFKATGGLDYTINLVEGQDIRDHNNDGFNNAIGNGALGSFYVGTASFAAGQVRLDEQAFTLPAAFHSATLTDIILHGDGDYPDGNPFLAAATVSIANTIKLDNLPLDGQYHIDASPSMPDIQAELTGIDPSVASSLLVTWVEQVSFDPDDDPTGHADPDSANTIVDTKQTIGTHVTFSQSDIPGEIQGGRVTINATTIVDKKQINETLSILPGTDTPIMIVGDNPTSAAVISFVQSLGTPSLAAGSSYDFSKLVDAIIMRESGGDTLLNRQFSSNGIPYFNTGGDSGVGLMQITNTDTSPNRSNDDIWNWKDNILDGFGILEGTNTTANPGISGLVQANNHFTSEIKSYKPKLAAIAAQYHYNSVTIAAPTTDQLVLTAIGLYNNGSLYNSEYNRALIPTTDPNDPGHGIIQLVDGRNPYVALVLADYKKL